MALDTEHNAKAFLLHAVCEKPVITDLLEAFGKDMLKETPHELLMRDRYHFFLIGTIVIGPERDHATICGDDPGVGDGDPVGIAAKVINGIAKTIERFLYERTPCLFIKAVPVVFPLEGITELTAALRDYECPCFMMLFKGVHELALEPGSQHPDGDHEFRPAADKAHTGSKPCARNDAVDMRMVIELLSPCVKYLYDRGHRAKILFVSRKLQKSFCGRIMKKAIEELLVCIYDRIKFSRDGEDHMEVWPVNDLGTSGIYPQFFEDSLTVGAVPVAAGVVMHFLMSAFITDADTAAEGTGFTGHDGPGRLYLFAARIVGGKIVIPGGVEYLLYFQVMHCIFLPACPKGSWRFWWKPQRGGYI